MLGWNPALAKYRLAGYNTNYPQHIYCVTNNYIIDAVLNFFNYEKKPIKYKKDMALYNLSGIEDMDDIGRTKEERKAHRKEVREKIKKAETFVSAFV